MKAEEYKKKFLKEPDKFHVVARTENVVDDGMDACGVWYHVHNDEEIPIGDTIYLKKSNPKINR